MKGGRGLFFLAALVVVLAVVRNADAAATPCQSDFDCVRGFCIRSTCQSRSNVGGPCQENVHCFGSFTCVNLFCVVPVPRDGTCDDDDDCALRNDICDSGTCISDADPCSVNDDCTDPETCINGECSDMSDLEQECDDNDDCNDPNTCVDGICVVPVPSGDPCDDSEDCLSITDVCSGDVCTVATWTNGLNPPYGTLNTDGSQFSILETLNDQIFFACGQKTSGQPQVAKLANPITATSTWTTGSVITRNGAVSGVFNNQIYIFGGRAGIAGLNGPIGTAVILPSSLSFSTLATPVMPTAVHSACGAQIGSKLYVFGGSRASVFTTLSNKVQVFDYNGGSPTWTTLTATLPEGRVYCAATVYNGLIYIFGGSTGFPSTTTTLVPSILIFNPATETFEDNTGFPTFARMGATADTIYGRIILTGGSTTATSSAGTKDVLVFDPEAKTFSAMTNMNTARSFHGSSVVNQDGDQILVVANGNQPGLRNSFEFIKNL